MKMADTLKRGFASLNSLNLFKNTIKKMYKECERMIEDYRKNPILIPNIDIKLPFLDYTSIDVWYDTSIEKILSKDELKKTIYLRICSTNISMTYTFYTDTLEVRYVNYNGARHEIYDNISGETNFFFIELFRNTVVMIYTAMDQFHMLKCTDELTVSEITDIKKEEEKMDFEFNKEKKEDVFITVNDIIDECNKLYNTVEAEDFTNDGHSKIIIIKNDFFKEIDLKYIGDKINAIICIYKNEYYSASLSISFGKDNTYDMQYTIDKIEPNFNKDVLIIENRFDITQLYSAIKNEIDKHNIKKPINVFISQPMNGLSMDEIKSTRDKLVDKFKRYLKKKDPKTNYIVKVLDNLQENAPEYYTHLDYISNDIRIIQWADIIVFANGSNNARGCIVEDLVWYNYKSNGKDMKGEDKDRYEFIRKHIGLNKFTESMIDDYLNNKD